ncbi:MAG TPA: hypothetical protein VJZ71_02075 [Phycisphaerae bacterium]|nr:hypothetical protein [Phycisphaerae bacterium]
MITAEPIPTRVSVAPTPDIHTPSRRKRPHTIGRALLLVAITLAAHGLALFDGVVLDDFWHQKGLREHGWSFSELLRTLNIAPVDFLETWWQTKDVCWHYLRPFFIVCMKTVYFLGGQNPVALHAFSILLHTISGLLVWQLCRKLTRNEPWSLIGGLMFVIYPHSIISVAWPSSLNCVIQTTLLLGTILCYLRASQLDVGLRLADRDHDDPAMSIPPVARRPLAFAAIFWLLAIFTRENAILLPAILASFEVAFGSWRRLWARRRLYVVAGVVVAAFMAWREWMQIHPLPDVYCRRPDGDNLEYAGWLAAKFLHYVCVSIWPAPMTIGPTGRFNPWSTVPGDCLLMLSIIAAIGTVYALVTRRARGWWIWPLWIGLSVLPVTAVIATPHSGYMCGVGFGVGMALTGACLQAVSQKWLVRTAGGLIVLLILGMAFMSPVNRLQWVATYSAERHLPSWVMVSPPPREARDVFFINMPFVNIYCKPNLVARLGPWFEDTTVHVLTYAPQPHALDRRTSLATGVDETRLTTIVEQMDDRRFTVAIQGQPYFSRLLGRFLLEAFRGKGTFLQGQDFAGKAFDVKIVEADVEGVWKMMFTFPRPLNDPSYCFYLTSVDCGAARLRFRTTGQQLADVPSSLNLIEAGAQLDAGHASAAMPLFGAVLSNEVEPAGKASESLFPVVQYMARATGAPVQSILDRPQLSREDWQRLRDWWQTSIDDQQLRELWLHRHDFDDLTYLRSEFDWDRYLASFIFNSDLYMTGPPYDGPRPRT